MRSKLSKEITKNIKNLDDLNLQGVYTITSKVNGKIYVGSTYSSYGFKLRWKAHITQLKHNKHYNQYLQNHVNKYGLDDLDFEILDICEPKYVLSLEQYWINMLDSVNNGFNIFYPKINEDILKRRLTNVKKVDTSTIINLRKVDRLSILAISKRTEVPEYTIRKTLKENNVNEIRAIRTCIKKRNLVLFDSEIHFNVDKPVENITDQFNIKEKKLFDFEITFNNHEIKTIPL